MTRTHSEPKPIYPEPHPASSPAWVDVDLDAVRHNAQRLAQAANVPLVAMVKADAYGVGMLAVARALGANFDEESPTAIHAPWALGVATLDEAETLRAAGYLGRILCTSPLDNRDVGMAHALSVRPSLHRVDAIAAWQAAKGRAWHLSIDTGMSRAGVRWDEVSALKSSLRSHPPEGIFTHFHSAELADGSRELQDQRFSEALDALGDAVDARVLLHSDNSAGIAARTIAARAVASSNVSRQLARPGIGLYGSNVTEALQLQQVVHLRARVIDVRDVLHGESVSYGASWHAQGTRRIATVALGYADGYRRALSNRGEALLHGTRVPVAGTVTMDMTMLDVTALGDRCVVGDVATFIGRDGDDCLWTDDVAARADISPYELLVGLKLRAPRRYFESGVSS